MKEILISRPKEKDEKMGVVKQTPRKKRKGWAYTFNPLDLTIRWNDWKKYLNPKSLRASEIIRDIIDKKLHSPGSNSFSNKVNRLNNKNSSS